MKRRITLGAALAGLLSLGIWALSPFGTEPPLALLPNLEGVEPNVAEKVQRLHAAVVSDPRPENWGLYARTLQAHDMRREAIHAYRVAADKASSATDRFEYLYLAGYIEALSGPEEALRTFEEALKIRDNYAPLHLRLGELHEKERRYDKAQFHYESALRIQESSHALLGLGRVAMSEGRIKEALAYLEKAVALAPNHREVNAALAQAYARAGREEEARRAASAAGDLAQTSGFLDPIVIRMAQEGVSYASHVQLAIANLKTGSFQVALQHIDDALGVQPNGVDAHFHKGRILASLNRYEEASKSFDRILSVQPEHVESMVMKSACLIKLGRLREALTILEKALELDPHHLNIHYTLGVVLQKASPEKAKEHLRFVLEKVPQRVDARIVLAATLAQEERFGEAQRELLKVLEQDPLNAAARRLLEGISRN